MLDFNTAIDLSDVDEKLWKTYIGNGYRNCCYLMDHERRGRIVLFGYDRDGNPKTFICPHKSHIKYAVKYKTNEKDIFGRYVETRYFNSSYDRKKYLDSIIGSINIVEALPPQNEFLHKMFDEVALDDHFNNQKMRIFYYDIETEISEYFEKAKDARNRINALTVYDSETKKYYTWSLNKTNLDLNDEYDVNGKLINECQLKNLNRDDFVIFDHFNNNESRMLEHFLDWYELNYPDVLCGFNSQSFDDVYLIRRIENVLSKNDASRMSPVGKYRFRENNLDNERSNKQAELLVDIDGVFQADELVLYRDKFKINQPLDGGNSLDNVGETECGIHKIHYKNLNIKGHPIVHSLKELYEKDWDRFIKYNIMDVYCLKTVEEKVKTIPLSRFITSVGLSKCDSIYSSIGYLIGSLIMFSKTQMGTIFTSFQNKKSEPIPFEGAFVFDPIPGLYKNGIATIDFASLYPSSIRALGISPETYVGKISRFPITDPTSEFFTKEPPIDLNGTDIIGEINKTSDEKEYLLKYKNSYRNVEDKDIKVFYLLPANSTDVKKISREQLDNLLETKCIFSRNNTLHLKHSIKKGVVSSWCKHFYTLRKTTKTLMQKLDLDLYNNRILENDKPSVIERIGNLHDRQQAIKIMINSIYGCLSTPHSPIYNPYLSQAITRNGKFLNISTSEYITKMFFEKYGDKNAIIKGIGENGKKILTYSCSGDTDSVVFSSKVRVNSMSH